MDNDEDDDEEEKGNAGPKWQHGDAQAMEEDDDENVVNSPQDWVRALPMIFDCLQQCPNFIKCGEVWRFVP